MENSNPAIVSRETFQAAQNLLRSRKTERCKRKSYPLTGKLRCPECGRVFRHQVVNGKAHWICSCRSSGATECQHRHVREDIVYDIFSDMVIKLKTYRGELLGTLIHQMETMQDRTSRNQERIRQIDKEIADLGAKNHVIARLHTSGAMNAADYAMQTSGIGNRLTELRIERRQKLTEDEDDQLLATLKDLNASLERRKAHMCKESLRVLCRSLLLTPEAYRNVPKQKQFHSRSLCKSCRYDAAGPDPRK